MTALFIAAGLFLFPINDDGIPDSKASSRFIDIPVLQGLKSDTFLINYLKRNIRYPLAAVKDNQENTLHFILRLNAEGKIDHYEILDKPVQAPVINDIFIVGSYTPDRPIKFSDSQNNNTELFASSLKQVFGKIKAPKNQFIIAKQYYFKVSFRIEKTFDRVVEPS